MKQIKQTENEHHWPRNNVESIKCRKRDLVIRIADWTRTKDEPAFDVEVYIGGVYDWNESETFTIWKHGNKAAAKRAAVLFASEQISRLL